MWGRYGFDVGVETLGAFRGWYGDLVKTYYCNWQRLRTSSLIAARSTQLWLRVEIERHLATKVFG
jgi:hypothetical protein